MLALLTRPVLRPALLVALLAPLLAFSSLARQPGYELATALAILLTVAGNLPAMALVQLRREQGRGADPLDLFLQAWALAVGLCLPALLVSLVSAAATTRCDPLAGMPFCLLLVPSCAAVTSAVGLAWALAFRDRRRAELAYLLTALASAIATAWPILLGPQVFAFNPFAGYFPGPIYDEAVQVNPQVLWSRLEAAGWTTVALAVATAGTDPLTLVWSWRSRRLRPLAALVAAALGVAWMRVHAGELGTCTRTEDVEHLLASTRETAHFRIHHPADRPRAEIERLARDLEFRYAQDSHFLGVEEEQKIDAYYYRSAEEKQRWVGAAETDFAKPWLHQFHLQLEGVPDPVAKHELAHVLANRLGVRPFGTAGGSLIPNAGLIEGLATAADDPVDDLTLDQQAAALRRLHLAPEVTQLFSAQGFWGEEQNRAYTLAGSFLRWIARTRGTAALQSLYHSGDFAQSCGASLQALGEQWAVEVDRTPLDDRALHLAQRRFSEPSLFAQACARERAGLRQQANAVAGSNPTQARALLERLVELEPGNPDPLFSEADLAYAQHRPDEVQATLRRIVELPHVLDEPRARAELGLAALAVQAHDEPEARRRLQAVIDAQSSASTTRRAELQRSAVDDRRASEALDHYFRQAGREQSLLELQQLVEERPTLLWLPRYLVGRRLTDLGLPLLALPYLGLDPDAATQAALPLVAREWLRLRLRDEAALLDCERVQADAARLVELAGGPNSAEGLPDARWSADWSERCQFERATFHFPVEPD